VRFFSGTRKGQGERRAAMDPVEILVNLSGRSRENCLQMYEVSGYNLDLAATYLLEEPNDGDVNQKPSIETPASTLPYSKVPRGDYYQELLQAELNHSSGQIEDNFNFLSEPEISTRFQELKFNEKKLHTHKLLIPQYRLEELVERTVIPDTIQFQQILICDSIIPIPGGITICEVSSMELEDLETFLSVFAMHLCRYEMTHCFILDTITKRENRLIFIQQLRHLLPTLFGLNPQDLHADFHEQVIHMP
jgi:hypothetical protein